MLENFVSTPENTNQIDKSNLEAELKPQENKGKQQQLPPPLYPKLAASVNSYQDRIVFSQESRDFAFQVKGKTGERLKRILLMMDGTNSLTKLQQTFSPNNPAAINTVLRYLDDNKLLDDASHLNVESGLNALLELSDLSNELLKNQLVQNQFTFNKLDSSDLGLNIIYGFAIEAHHLFAHQTYIDSSALTVQNSIQIQQLINQLYCQKYGQDRLLAEALNSIGISNEDLIDIIPLPQTMALCNGLAYWASFDSLFYFSILGVLINQNIANLTSYLQACESLEINHRFLEPIKTLINSQGNSEAKNISREIFQEISHVDKLTQQRFKAQTYLFAEIFTNFYTAIFNYYSSGKSLLRRVSEI
jgi:hypothetical protein